MLRSVYIMCLYSFCKDMALIMRAMWFLSTSMLMYHDLLNHGLRFHENSPWGLC